MFFTITFWSNVHVSSKFIGCKRWDNESNLLSLIFEKVCTHDFFLYCDSHHKGRFMGCSLGDPGVVITFDEVIGDVVIDG